jgi:hypothetical protein
MKRVFICFSVMTILLTQIGCATTRLGGAAKGGDLREVEALLSKGADVNEKGLMGASPLYEAILYQAPFNIVQTLIDKGADVNRGLINGWRPIHLAVQNNDEALVKLLLERGADTAARNGHGKTPLRIAEEKGYSTIARMIREAEEKKYPSIVSRQKAGSQQNSLARETEIPSQVPIQSISRMRLAKDRVKVAVWDLVPRNTSVSNAAELTSILVSEISKLGTYEVYSQDNVRTLAGWTAERMQLGCTDSKCLTALGQMDVGKLISGSVGKIGDRYSISLNLFDTQNARSEKSISEFCRSENELIELVQMTVRRLLASSL